MKKGVLVYIVLCSIILAGVTTATVYCHNSINEEGEEVQTNCCEYDDNERDASSEICERCGHLWFEEVCCNNEQDYFCILGGGSCVNGESNVDHCYDNVQNCDEGGVDCGGADCVECCYSTGQDGYCPITCGPDEDIDCCVELFSTTEAPVPWVNEMRCCNGPDNWCTGGGSCVYGYFFDDHCNDFTKNCDEEGIDCGGSCGTCGLEADGWCSSTDIMLYMENDPDCCSRIGGTFGDGRCCWPGGRNWCVVGGGSCIVNKTVGSGVYSSDHCTDGVQNKFCASYETEKYYSFLDGKYVSRTFEYTAETAVDVGSDCN